MRKIFIAGVENSLRDEVGSAFGKNAEIVNDLKSADLVIESRNYPLENKITSLNLIEANVPENIPVFTSSLCHSVSEQSAGSRNPGRLIGIGLYNTFSKAKRIEIAPSKIIDEAILKNAEKILIDLGMNYSKVPDRVGLIFPRIISMIINEAVQVYSEKIASKEDIDTAMKLGTNYPLGPLEWADKIGIELVYNILTALQRDFGEDRYRPHPALKEMIDLKLKFYKD
jgi:3-hydroxybutyryl-CoA dehydrogenase